MLPIQAVVNVPGKAAEDGLSTWVLYLCGRWERAPGPDFGPTQLPWLWSFGEWTCRSKISPSPLPFQSINWSFIKLRTGTLHNPPHKKKKIGLQRKTFPGTSFKRGVSHVPYAGSGGEKKSLKKCQNGSLVTKTEISLKPECVIQKHNFIMTLQWAAAFFVPTLQHLYCLGLHVPKKAPEF